MSDFSKINIGDLPVDVFEVEEFDLTARSLTAGHGMAEGGASCAICSCAYTCGCVATLLCVVGEAEEPEIP